MPTKKSYSQAARVQGILRTLGTRQGITIGELAEEFGVTKRTLYRDLKALEEAGYPIFYEVVDEPEVRPRKMMVTQSFCLIEQPG